MSTLDVRLIENQNGWRERERSGEREQLLLTHGEGRAALRDRAVQAVREVVDEAVGVHGRGGPLDVRLANASVAEPNVLGNRAREQIHILKHEAEQGSAAPQAPFHGCPPRRSGSGLD